MNLQEKLDAKKKELETAIPEKALEIMHRSTEELSRSPIMETVKTKGDTAPDFTLNNYKGKAVSLSDSLSRGPVVLGFYRGGW